MESDKYVNNAAPIWTPMMHMWNMSHSAPHITLENTAENSVYKGHIVFQMANNDTEYWELVLNYSLNGRPTLKVEYDIRHFNRCFEILLLKKQ